jgi:hypothetical protein
MFVDVYTWIQQFQMDALRNGDSRRLRLIEYQTQAWQHFETNPQQSLQILYEARDLAEQLHEPCWMLYYDSWLGECLNLYLINFKQGLQHAMKTVVEIRKPEYEKCTMLCRGYRIVIESYIYSDPVGYADKIRELIAYTDNDIPINYDTYCILKKRESELEFALGRIEPAIQAAQAYLQRSSEQLVTFHMAYAYEMLVHYAYLQGNISTAQTLIKVCEAMARDNQRRSLVAIAQAWRALFSLMQGQKEDAQTLYRLATSNMSQLGMAVSLSYYEAVCTYNEQSGDIEQSLTVRDNQLQAVSGRGGYYLETEVLLKKARLQGRMGQNVTSTVAQTQHIATHLSKPNLLLNRLRRVENGDFTEDFA